jgi:tetratricopeptide (TPR) repeat protein
MGRDSPDTAEGAELHLRERIFLRILRHMVRCGENPDYGKTHNFLGMEIRAGRNYAEAIEKLRLAETIVPEFYEAPYLRGRIHHLKRRDGEAARAYRKALVHAPDWLLPELLDRLKSVMEAGKGRKKSP